MHVPSLIDRLNKLGTALVASIVTVWESEHEPGSDVWQIWTDARQRLIDRITEDFSKRTGIPRERFPFSNDFVIDLWVRYRKGAKDQKQAIHEHLEIV